MKLVAITIVKNEADIVQEHLENICPHVDEILVLDNDSTDSTYDLYAACPKVTYLEKTSAVFQNGMRGPLIELARKRHGPKSWMVFTSPDQFFETDPRKDIEDAIRGGRNCIRYYFPCFFITRQEYARWDQEDTSLPVRERRTWYANPSINPPTVYLNQDGIRYRTPGAEPPYVPHMRALAGEKYVMSHYRFRSPEQTAERLKLRQQARDNGTVSFRHMARAGWDMESYFIDQQFLRKHVPGKPWKLLPRTSLTELVRRTATLKLQEARK